MGNAFLYSGLLCTEFYEGTSAQDLYSQDHKYGYSCIILSLVTTETCSKDRGEQKEQILSLPCSADISCTKLQQTSCLPCIFSAHLSVVKANAKCC